MEPVFTSKFRFGDVLKKNNVSFIIGFNQSEIHAFGSAESGF